MPTTIKPLYLNSGGVLQQMPSGAITNIGGTDWPNFTVNGKGLLFDDGSSTDPSGSAITLQTVYNNSTDMGGSASIKLATNKDFVLYDDTSNALFFKVEANTGNVVMTGNLTVLGSTTTINSTIIDSDHQLISPSSPAVTALKIEPDTLVTPLVDLVTIRRIFGGPTVFRIDKDGNTITTNLTANGNLTVTGTINGVNLVSFYNSFVTHTTASATPKHLASEIFVIPVPIAPSATNVQAALEEISTAIENISVGGPPGTVSGFEHQQIIPAATWVVAHNKNTRKVQYSIYDSSFFSILPDSVELVDLNTIQVHFASPQTGSVILVTF